MGQIPQDGENGQNVAFFNFCWVGWIIQDYKNLISHPFETTSSFLGVRHRKDFAKSTLCVFNLQLDIVVTN